MKHLNLKTEIFFSEKISRKRKMFKTSYPMGTGGIFPGVKQQGYEADHSPPSSAQVQKCGAIPPLPHTPSWHSA
jgi:hypothetical protein